MYQLRELRTCTTVTLNFSNDKNLLNSQFTFFNLLQFTLLKLLHSEFVAQTEALEYHLPQVITSNGKKTSHLSLISRAK